MNYRLTVIVAAIFFSLLSGMENNEKMSYIELYENGYYAETIALLSDTANMVTIDNIESENRKKILAFSLILSGRKDAAMDVLWSIFDKNPLFNLDPILTSPTIYEVFSETRREWNGAYEANVTLNYSPLTNFALKSRILLPFGVGQYINDKKKKGIIFSIFQAGALAGSIVTYNIRDSYYDPDFGWYEGNNEMKNIYTNAMRIQFGLFAVAYVWSVVDAYREMK
jgi:hypothetical protein